MNCHNCGDKTSVIDRRYTRRRRECPSCGERFTTYEVTDADAKRLKILEKFTRGIKSV